MSKARSARSGPPRKTWVSEDKAKSLIPEFDSSATRRAIFSEVRTRLAQLSTDAGVGETPGWLKELRQQQQAIPDKPSSAKSFYGVAGLVKTSVRHVKQERRIAAALQGGDSMPNDEETERKEKAKIEALLSKLEHSLTMETQERTHVVTLKQTFQELQRALDPSAFSDSIQDIHGMLEDLHSLQAKFDELSVESTTSKLSDELKSIRRRMPNVVRHVRKGTDEVWNKLRRARHTQQQRRIAAALLRGDSMPKDEETKRKEKAKIEALLSKLEHSPTMEARERTHVATLKQTVQELHLALVRSSRGSTKDIKRMLENLHSLEAKFDEPSVESTKLSDELNSMRRSMPNFVRHVRKETDEVWNKLRHATNAEHFAWRIGRLQKDHHAASVDARKMQQANQLEDQKATFKTMLRTSESWSKISDESTLLKFRGPETATWSNWWPERDPEGYDRKRAMQFFDTLPPDMLSQQEEDLRDAIFLVFARDDKTWRPLKEVAQDERVRLCKQRFLPDFVSIEDWILQRHHVGQQSSPTTVPSTPRLPGISQTAWTKTESQEKGFAATTGFRGGFHAEEPTSARQATMFASVKQASMQSAQSRRAMGLQVDMNEDGDLCCSLEGQHLSSMKPQPRVGEEKSFGWIKRLEETHVMPCRPTPLGTPTVEEVVAWRVSHRYRRREVDPSLAKMWRTYDTIIQPAHIHTCQCEKCTGRLPYELPVGQDTLL